jgi:tRNA (guanine-N(7)-)-methyltransferase subunit TRM82
MAFHVFHEVVVNRKGTVIYLVSANTVQAFDLKSGHLLHKYESVLTGKKNDTKGPAKPSSEVRNYLNLAKLVDEDNYLLCSQSEEKSVLVLRSDDLSLVSRRLFPKRPSAVDVMYGKEKTLLVGDKFGDVYAIDLESTDPLRSDIAPALGHVSMLVDVAAAQHNGKQYVISADRDEHIRVTRFPQTFVIERWLFGHSEFVSSIAVVPWQDELLVSGGGDDFLCLWNWTSGKLLSIFELRDIVSQHLNENHAGHSNNEDVRREITVSKLVCWQGSSGTRLVFALIEGTGLLLSFKLVVEETQSQLELAGKLVLDKNIISFSVAENGDGYLTIDDTEEMLVSYHVNDNGEFSQVNNPVCQQIVTAGSLSTELTGSNPIQLYGVRQLRKRGGH